MSKHHKNRLPPFVPLLISTIDTEAWRHMSHGAKALYVALKRRVPNAHNRSYLSHRTAAKELKSYHRKVREWFAELDHYGFIALAVPGSLGVDGKGKAPHWRLTEKGSESKRTADGLPEPPTRDFQRWDGVLFDPKPFRLAGGEFKKQNPGDDGITRVVTTASTPPLTTASTPNPQSVDDGITIEREPSGDDGITITSFATTSDQTNSARETWAGQIERRKS